MSEVKVNKISPRTNCGTVQLGDSGDTITIPAGATITNNGTQTGFGRTGTVDWQTGSIKTSTFTAADGEGYFVDTSSGAITVNLPAGSAGAIVAFSDYTRTFNTHNLTISPNGSNKIGGIAADATLNTQGQTATFVFVDATEGWINIQETSNSVTGTSFITATGGTITTVCTNFKVHTFTSPGTFCVSQIASCSANNQVSYMVVAGGGGGGCSGGGGGGGGGYREDKSPVTPYTASPLDGAGDISVTATAFPITVGAGGAAGTPGTPATGSSGADSIFSTITSAGGGGGGSRSGGVPPPAPSARVGVDGGSGGGGGGTCGPNPNPPGGAGNTPPVSPPQGSPGGAGISSGNHQGGGGGGAGGSGASGDCSPDTGGPGGNGTASSINGTPTTRAGGGGGGNQGPTAGTGGPGGGGAGGLPGSNATAGTTNTGGGGGGTGFRPSQSAANGGSGIVIIRYKFQ